jgi:hypothetical protein
MTMKAIKFLKTMPAVLLIVMSLALVAANPADAEVIAPTTTISLSGTHGNFDWFTSDVVVTLSATDMSNTGINRTEYSFNGSAWNRYTGPINITKEGTTAVYYRSVDNASDIETTKMKVVSIDKTAPSITYTLTPPLNVRSWSNQSMLLHFESSDSVSGLAEHTPDATLTNEGTYSSLTGIASDVAGNTASVTVPTFNIDKTPPVVGSLTVTDNTYLDAYVTASAGVIEANPHRVEMDWGDGTVSQSSISDNVAMSMHAYKQAGKYKVTLIVVDMAGNIVMSAADVMVNAPSVPATPTPVPTPEVTVMPTPTPTPVPTPTPTARPAPSAGMLLSAISIAAAGILAIGCRRKRKDGQ